MGNITVVIPTSLIPSHPSTRIIERTLASVRSHLPDAPIIVTCDGLAHGTPYNRARYDEYMSRLVGVAVKRYGMPIHQSGMLVDVLPSIKTQLLLYLEHDWELGHPIEWAQLESIILSGEAHYVKFYQSNRIHPLHEHMMLERVIWRGAPLIKTLQYSANPHLASTTWYRTLVESYFRGRIDYIENLLHGPIAIAPWADYKLLIYNPVQGDMKRSFHLDGAGSKE